jgi:hypothetical protein
VLRRGFETADLDSRLIHGLNHVENENGIMHYQTSLQRRTALPAATAIIERVF